MQETRKLTGRKWPLPSQVSCREPWRHFADCKRRPPPSKFFKTRGKQKKKQHRDQSRWKRELSSKLKLRNRSSRWKRKKYRYRTESGIIKNAGSTFGCISLRLIRWLTKSFSKFEFLDVKVIISKMRKTPSDQVSFKADLLLLFFLHLSILFAIQ